MKNKLMKKQFLISVMVCILLSACNVQGNSPTPIFTLTPTPTSNQPIGPLTTPTFTPTPTINQPIGPLTTPTFTPFPSYPEKKVVLEYYIVGQLSYFGTFYAEGYSADPKFVLYDDGQMIAGEGQIFLSTDEIENLLSELDSLGFFSLESNQKHDEEDKLYKFGSLYDKVFDGLKYCILANGDISKKLCVYEPYMQFLIPEMERILKYLDEYKPTGLAPYFPDRILLSIQPADPFIHDLPADATPWDTRFLSLDFPPPRTYVYDNPPTILYIEGDIAKEVFIFLKNSQSGDVFIQEGKKYIVQYDVVLPHETIINGYQ